MFNYYRLSFILIICYKLINNVHFYNIFRKLILPEDLTRQNNSDSSENYSNIENTIKSTISTISNSIVGTVNAFSNDNLTTTNEYGQTGESSNIESEKTSCSNVELHDKVTLLSISENKFQFSSANILRCDEVSL